MWGFGNMGELKVVLNEELLKAFRERAFRIFGFRKGSLKKAVELAIRDFIERVDIAQTENLDLSKIRGVLKDLNVSSVDLQHRALRLWAGE